MKLFKNVLAAIGIFAVVILICGIISMNIGSLTLRGVNYEVQEMPIPLFTKALNFIDRYYSQKWLLTQVIEAGDDSWVKAKKLSTWTYREIRPQPSSLPVIDDHPWHIVVRGYGTPEQKHIVLATLANVAGVESMAVMLPLVKKGSLEKHYFAAMRIGGFWRLCDLGKGVVFVDDEGLWCKIDSLKSGDFKVLDIDGTSRNDLRSHYLKCFTEGEWPDLDEKYSNLPHAAIQTPFKRLEKALLRE